jgi:hypothetical protein
MPITYYTEKDVNEAITDALKNVDDLLIYWKNYKNSMPDIHDLFRDRIYFPAMRKLNEHF